MCFLPNPSGAFWTAHVRQPGFFTTWAYRRSSATATVALVFPYADRVSWSMLWQGETGFRFRMIGGHIGQAIIPSECKWAGDWESLAGGAPPGGAAGFRRFLLAHHVDVIVEAPATTSWPRQLDRRLATRRPARPSSTARRSTGCLPVCRFRFRPAGRACRRAGT